MFYFKYTYSKNKHYDANAVVNDPKPIYYSSSMETATAYDYNEHKKVYGLELLLGKTKRLSERWIIDTYFGLGVRLKHRLQLAYNYGTARQRFPYDPPKELTKVQAFPTIHFGFNLGIIRFKN